MTAYAGLMRHFQEKLSISSPDFHLCVHIFVILSLGSKFFAFARNSPALVKFNYLLFLHLTQSGEPDWKARSVIVMGRPPPCSLLPLGAPQACCSVSAALIHQVLALSPSA